MDTEEETMLVAYLLDNYALMDSTVSLAKYFLASLPDRQKCILRAFVLERKSLPEIGEPLGLSKEQVRKIIDGIDSRLRTAIMVSCIASPGRESGEATTALMKQLTQVVWPLVRAGRPKNLLVHFGRDGAQASIPLGDLRAAMREHGFDGPETTDDTA